MTRLASSVGGSRRKSSRVRRVIKGSFASLLALVGLVAFATPAFAHDNFVSARASCASPLGSGYTIVWSIANDFNLPETGSVTSVTGGLATLSTTSFSVAASPGQPYSSTTITQTLPATASGLLTLDISSRWSDGFTTTDSGVFNLAQLNCAGPSQTIAGHIYLCNNSNPTTTEVTGGTLAASGPTTVSGTPNPLAPTQVGAGGYTMTTTAPPGYTLVACGGSSTPDSSGSTATEPVTVPSGGAGVGIFYVVQSTPITQTIAGHIYLCTSGSQTTTEVPGGALAATGPTTVPGTPNPLAPTQVGAGGYTMTATAPPGYTLVACGGSSTPDSSGSTATEPVTVPSGGAGVGIFYVVQSSPITQTIAGHIYLCNSGSQTTTEVPGGTLAASGPTTVSSSPNPLGATPVGAGGYTMTATAPPGYTLVVCGGSSTPTSSGSTATESVTVPSGGAGVGIFYVDAPVTGPTSTTGSGGSGGTGTSTPASSPATSPASSSSATSPDAPATTAALAFTGAPLTWEWLFGLLMVLLGSPMVLVGRMRRGLAGKGHLEVAAVPNQSAAVVETAPRHLTEQGRAGSFRQWTTRRSRGPRPS